jgi:hypothetical protein
MPLRSHVILPSVLASLAIFAGCGSGSGIIHPLPGGFSKASLKGQYVMTQSGIGVNQARTSADPFAEVTIFTADGNGNLNVLEDDFNQDSQQYPPGSGTGTYSVSRDGTGVLSFGGLNFAITLIDDNHFYLIEEDSFATSSGYGQMQDTAAFGAAPSGTFVFKAHNIDSSSRVGGITITGGVISGTEDFLTLGSLSTSASVTSAVSMSAPSSTTGRGTFTLTDGSSFGYYVVNSSKFYFLSNTNSLELGQAEMQTGGPFSVATLASGNAYVFGSSGDTNNFGQAAIHSAGVFTTDGNGNITAGAADYVQDTTVNSNLTVASGSTYTLTSNGRGQINLTLSGGSISPQIFWLVNGSAAYFLANNTLAVEDGTFSLQTGAPFNALAGQSAFAMDGIDGGGFKDRVGDFVAKSSGFNWNQTANSFDPSTGIGSVTLVGTNGTATVSSNGRVDVTVNGVTPSLVFYLSSPSSGFMVQEDASVGGAFTQQASQ